MEILPTLHSITTLTECLLPQVSVEVIMEPKCDSFNLDIMKIDSVCLSDLYVKVFREGRYISNISEEKYVILESCTPVKKYIYVSPFDSPNEFFYFYEDVLGVFWVGVSFKMFEAEILIVLTLIILSFSPIVEA